MKLKNKYLQLFYEFLPLIISLLLLWIIKNEFLVTILLIITLLISFKIKYYKGEWKLFFIGLIAGVVLEVISDLVYQLQTWETATFLSVPLWLLVFWGLGFVFIRRAGNLIVK